MVFYYYILLKIKCQYLYRKFFVNLISMFYFLLLILIDRKIGDIYMNQILFDIKEHKKYFKSIFFISLLLIFFISFFLLFKLYIYKKNENFTNVLSYNYNTLKLYSNETTKKNKINNFNTITNCIIGEIKIPTINVSYPIFSNLSDENLKIYPCIFSGKMPPKKSNLCIAGHNYDNKKFFSLIYKLKKEDKIYIYDTNNHEYIYSVFANYEVKTDDLSPINSLNYNKYELTLITCNNFNNNRIIIKARI